MKKKSISSRWLEKMASHRYEFQIAISYSTAVPLHITRIASGCELHVWWWCSRYDDDDDARDRDDEHDDVAAADDDNALVMIGLIVTIICWRWWLLQYSQPKGPLGVVWFENANENTLEFPNKGAVWSVGILGGDRGETKTPEHPLLIAFCTRLNNGPWTNLISVKLF